MVAVRLGATLDETEGLRRGNSAIRPLSSESRPSGQGGSARPPGGGARETERLPNGCAFDLTRELATAIRARRTEARIGGWLSSAGCGWSIATRGRRSAPRPSGGWRRSWR